jgi:hypothetical protein
MEIGRLFLSNNDVLNCIYSKLSDLEDIRNLFLCCKETASKTPRVTSLVLEELSTKKMEKLLSSSIHTIKTLKIRIGQRKADLEIPKMNLSSLETIKVKSYCSFFSIKWARIPKEKRICLNNFTKNKELKELAIPYQPYLTPYYRVDIRSKKLEKLTIYESFCFSEICCYKEDFFLSLSYDEDTEIDQFIVKNVCLFLEDSKKIPVRKLVFVVEDFDNNYFCKLHVSDFEIQVDDISIKVVKLVYFGTFYYYDIIGKEISMKMVDRTLECLDEDKLEEIDITAFTWNEDEQWNLKEMNLTAFKKLKEVKLSLIIYKELGESEDYDDYSGLLKEGEGFSLKILLPDCKVVNFNTLKGLSIQETDDY